MHLFVDRLQLDQLHTTYALFAALALLAGAAGGLYAVGFVGWVAGLVGKLARAGITAGFRVWEAALSWATWKTFLALAAAALGVGVGAVGGPWNGLAAVVAVVLIAVGGATCVAYMYLSFERYEVARGYKAVHNPEMGQALAADLIRYESRLGVPTLAAAAVVTVFSFALLNDALFHSVGRGWYKLTDPNGRPVYLDFVAYTLVNLLRVVDILDLAESYRFLSVSLVRPGKWVTAYLLMGFKSFFTVVLLQQLFASVRHGRLLTETVTDFWSPHAPIRERAKASLPQFGPSAVSPILVALRSAGVLTQEQRDQLPVVLAGIGPAAVPDLLRHAADPHEPTRAVSASALGLLKVHAAVPRLARLTGDASEAVRLAAVRALGEVGESLAKHDGRAKPTAKADAGRWDRWAGVWRRVRGPRSAPLAGPTADPVADAVGALRGSLADPSEAVRERAARALGQVGTRAKAAGPDLVKLLTTDADGVRVAAAAALGALDWGQPDGLDALSAALGHPTPAVRRAAAEAVGTLRAAGVVASVVPLLQDPDDDVRAAAAAAVSRVGVLCDDSAKALVEGLSSPDNVVRVRTAESLGKVGEVAAAAAPALVEALDDSNDRVRGAAAEALGRLGESAAAVAVPKLVRLLRDEDNWVRGLAAEALGEMGSAAEEAAPALLRSLRHPNPRVRGNAAEALGKMEAADARPALERACGDDDPDVRSRAVTSLALLGPPTDATRDAVRTLVADPSPVVRAAVADALARFAPHWPAGVVLVTGLLADGNDDVTVRALNALQRFEPDTTAVVVAVRVRLRENQDSYIRCAAAAALGRMGPIAVPAGVDLAETARTGDADLREASMRALAVLLPDEAAGAFVAGLTDGEAEVRRVAAGGLLKLSTLPDEAVPALVEALRDPDSKVRASAAHVLSRLDAVPASAVPFLVDNTAAVGDDGLRLHSALALRTAGGDAAHAALRHLLHDPNGRVRLVAAGSLLPAAPADPDVGTVLRDALRGDIPRDRLVALELLETVGPAAAPFLPELTAWADRETDDAVRARIRAAADAATPQPPVSESAATTVLPDPPIVA